MMKDTRVENKLREHRLAVAVFAALLMSALALAFALTAGPARALPGDPCPDCVVVHSPPTVTKNSSTVTGDEGTQVTNSGTYDDTSDDDADTVSITVKDASGNTLGSVSGGGFESGTWNWSYTPPDGPSSQTLTVTARDSTGLSSSTTFTLQVGNVAPSATFSSPPGLINEGSPIGISLSNPTDPSINDRNFGFDYRFDCGSGFGTSLFFHFSVGASVSRLCPTSDNGVLTVGAQVRDKDFWITSYSSSVTVNNVAPNATFVAPEYVKVGSTLPLAMTNPTDPSSADTASGFNYAFDCGDGSGFAAASSSSSKDCTAPGTPTQLAVGGRIMDKDAGTRDQQDSVKVDGAAPGGTVSINNGARRTTSRKVTLNLSATDPAPASGVASMRFSNNGRTWSSWMAYATSKAWTLSRGTGTKTVFVQYKDNVGLVSAKAKDTIVYRP